MHDGEDSKSKHQKELTESLLKKSAPKQSSWDKDKV